MPSVYLCSHKVLKEKLACDQGATCNSCVNHSLVLLVKLVKNLLVCVGGSVMRLSSSSVSEAKVASRGVPIY